MTTTYVMLPGDKIVVRRFLKAIYIMTKISPKKNNWSVLLEERAQN